jgi:streptogramin lyase
VLIRPLPPAPSNDEWHGQVKRGTLVLAALALLCGGVGQVKAGFLLPGDLLVVQRFNTVIQVDPVTGAETTLSAGGDFTNLTGVAVAPNGSIYVMDQNAFAGALGAVFWVDPRTGAQTTISSGGLFVHPQGLTIAPDGSILVANEQGGNIVQVNPMTGAQSVLTYGINPTALAVNANGTVFGADLGTPSVFRVDPVSHAEITVSSGGFLSRPFGIAVAKDGELLVADYLAGGNRPGGIVEVNPATGALSMFSSGGLFDVPYGIATTPGGDIYVADQGTGVIRLDPETGDQSLVATGGDFASIAVYPAVVPEPSSLVLFGIGAVCLVAWCWRRRR